MKSLKIGMAILAAMLAMPTAASAAVFGFNITGDFTTNYGTGPLTITGTVESESITVESAFGGSAAVAPISNLTASFAGQTFNLGDGFFGGGTSIGGQILVGLGTLEPFNVLAFAASNIVTSGTSATANLALTGPASFNLAGLGNVSITGATNVTASVAAVPEPATWAMMIGGFGLVGAAMRRRAPRGAVALA